MLRRKAALGVPGSGRTTAELADRTLRLPVIGETFTARQRVELRHRIVPGSYAGCGAHGSVAQA